MTQFPVGTLVQARDREWVVLPDSTPDLLVLRPIGGTDDETTGILTALEDVCSASFEWPDAAEAGDHHSARLLRDALRLGFRSSAGPFRSFGNIAVEPRPYQLVPLLMALKQDPVRLLIADDVGIGKTIEASLIGKELLQNGTASRLAVLCPPHLAEQWRDELLTKFHVSAELVLSSTAPRLERNCGVGESVFDVYPYTIVSTDFIKTDRRRDEFLRSAPNLVIVDEAHSCAADPGRRGGGRHQRHELLAGLAADEARHLILVTATPHSGNEGAFRSLIGLLNPEFSKMADEERMPENVRRRLAQHMVQRRRADIRSYLDEDTPFPERHDLPEEDGRYKLTPEYQDLLQDALAWAREAVRDETGGQHRQRVRWWSVLALLRSLASSPAAAAATLRSRASVATTTSTEEADAAGRRTVLDQDEADTAGHPDAVPGTHLEDLDSDDDGRDPRQRRRLLDLARKAESLAGTKDAKLVHATKLVKRLIDDGYNPIVFCRFIDSAEYVAEHLRQARLGKDVEIIAVTGNVPSAEREHRVHALAGSPRRVLVATDCLSEGINLQTLFDSVVHYDLPWNPTRLEQREGRVDRYGQTSKSVRVGTVYAVDNVIDEIVLDVLLRKHQRIRTALGVSIPVPGSNDEFVEAVFARLFNQTTAQERLFDDSGYQEVKDTLFEEWDNAAEREKQSRTRFAQYTIKTDEVARELAAVRSNLGDGSDVRRFVVDAVQAHGGTVSGDGTTLDGPPALINLSETPPALRDVVGPLEGKRDTSVITAKFQPILRPGEVYLDRTHPVVEGIATYVLDTALDQKTPRVAARCGAIRTTAVTQVTALLVVRYRFDLTATRHGGKTTMLAEDTETLAVTGIPGDLAWLPDTDIEALLAATPSGNLPHEQRQRFVQMVVDQKARIDEHLAERARQRADELREAHERVRTESRATHTKYQAEPHLPADVLGVYVLVPGAPA